MLVGFFSQTSQQAGGKAETALRDGIWDVSCSVPFRSAAQGGRGRCWGRPRRSSRASRDCSADSSAPPAAAGKVTAANHFNRLIGVGFCNYCFYFQLLQRKWFLGNTGAKLPGRRAARCDFTALGRGFVSTAVTPGPWCYSQARAQRRGLQAEPKQPWQVLNTHCPTPQSVLGAVCRKQVEMERFASLST